jgi:hypothetical protein
MYGVWWRQLFALPRLSHGQRPALYTVNGDTWRECFK